MRPRSRLAPAVALLVANAFVLIDPFGWLYTVLREPSAASMMIRAWYFLGGIAPACALLAAEGLHALLARPPAPRTAWRLVLPAIALAALWSARLLYLWRPGGPEFRTGWSSLADAAAGVALLLVLILAYRRSGGAARAACALAIAGFAVVEYKAFGTCKRFNAARLTAWVEFPGSPLPFLHPDVIAEMRSHPDSRVAIDGLAVFTTQLRHAGLTTPQGFDPYLTTAYRRLLAAKGLPLADREFSFDLSDDAALQFFAVRYVLTRASSPALEALARAPRFRPLEPEGVYLKVFEYRAARPAYDWHCVARRVTWAPEHRVLDVESASGGVLRLAEQFYPGWRAAIDGRPVDIARCNEAWQCVEVPPGAHRVEFRFRSDSLRGGAWVSAASLIALAAALWLTRRPRAAAQPAPSGGATALQ